MHMNIYHHLPCHVPTYKLSSLHPFSPNRVLCIPFDPIKKFRSRAEVVWLKAMDQKEAVLLVVMSMFISSLVIVEALNIGLVSKNDASASLSRECSRKCESDFCSVPPFLRYSKYCGLLYSGCPGEMPCDGLDACCFNHDACVRSKNHGYLSQECSQRFLSCMKSFKNSGALSFKGNTCDTDDVIDIITVVMKAALRAGRYLHRP